MEPNLFLQCAFEQFWFQHVFDLENYEFLNAFLILKNHLYVMKSKDA
jgi:hypothetical protein